MLFTLSFFIKAKQKAADQMEWIGAMNNIGNRAKETTKRAYYSYHQLSPAK